MKRKFEVSKETILPIIVFVLSVLNILSNINNLSISILLSIIGIISTILFFKQNSLSTKLIYIWLIAQVIIIEPIFDLSQSSFTLAFTLGLGNYSLKINFLPLLFLRLLKVVESSNLIGKEINLIKFRENAISDFLPTKGKNSERLDFNENKNERTTTVPVAQLQYTKTCNTIVYFVNLFMQGKKTFTPQLFVSVNLLELVPVDNFYRKLLT